MKRSTREIIFFILVLLSFFLAIKSSRFIIKKYNYSSNTAYIYTSIIYTIFIIVFYYIAKLHSVNHEPFWDVTDYAQCKGGPWFWQGDSELSKKCRELANTPEGRLRLSNYNCPTGYKGQPGALFYFSPQSNQNWTNEQCMDIKKPQKMEQGLCSMNQQFN